MVILPSISRIERLTLRGEREIITFKVSSYISRGGSKERKVITLLLTLALEGSQLHATEGAEMTNGKRRTLNV